MCGNFMEKPNVTYDCVETAPGNMIKNEQKQQKFVPKLFICLAFLLFC